MFKMYGVWDDPEYYLKYVEFCLLFLLYSRLTLSLFSELESMFQTMVFGMMLNVS